MEQHSGFLACVCFLVVVLTTFSNCHMSFGAFVPNEDMAMGMTHFQPDSVDASITSRHFEPNTYTGEYDEFNNARHYSAAPQVSHLQHPLGYMRDISPSADFGNSPLSATFRSSNRMPVSSESLFDKIHSMYASGRFSGSEDVYASIRNSDASEAFSDKNGWGAQMYYITIQTLPTGDGGYYVVGRGKCGMHIMKVTHDGVTLVNKCGIPWSDEKGWNQQKHYLTVRSIIANGILYISARGSCGLHVYKLVDNEPVLVSKCDVKWSDEAGWGEEQYYMTIQAAVSHGHVYYMARGSCGMHIYILWTDGKLYLVNKCLIRFSDSWGWNRPQHYHTVKSAVVYEHVYVMGRASCGMQVWKLLAHKKVELVSNCDIEFSDAHGWTNHKYYSTISAEGDSDSLIISGRGNCGMYISRIVGDKVRSVSTCDIGLSDKNGWGDAKYYPSIGTTVVNDELIVYGRGACGMYIYSVDKMNKVTEFPRCFPHFSDKGHWDHPKYYMTIEGNDGGNKLAISGRAACGMEVFEQEGNLFKPVQRCF